MRALTAFLGEGEMFIFHLFYLEQEPLLTGHIFKNTTKITPFSVLLHLLHC